MSPTEPAPSEGLHRLLPRRLRLQTGVVVGMLLFGTIMVHTAYTSRGQAAAATRAIESQTESLAHNVAAFSYDYLRTEEYAALEGLLLRAGEFPNVLAIRVSGADGELLSSIEAKPDAPPRVTFFRDRLALPAGATPVRLREDARVVCWHPIMEEELIGWVRVDAGLAAVRVLQQRLWISSGIVGLAVVLLSTALVLLFLNRHIVAVRRVTDFAGRLRSQLGEQLPVDHSSLEIERLTTALNDTSRDLQQQRHSLAEGAEHVERLRRENLLILDSAAEGIIGVDNGGVLTFVNHAAAELLGYGAAAPVGEPWEMLLPGDAANPLAESGASSAIRAGELVSKQGEKIPVELSVTPIVETGTRRGTVVTFRDVTVERRLENELRQAQKMEAIGRLTGGIAHDFNNVLTALLGYASVLKARLPRDSPLLDYVRQIVGAAERASSLTASLLTFSRKQIRQPRAVDLNEVVARSTGFVVKLVGEDVEVTRDLANRPLVVVADPGQIDLVLLNLAANARDAMPAGGKLSFATGDENLDARILEAHGVEPAARFARLTVADNGAGMDAETRARVFEPFFTTKPLGKGTGLGLSTAYGIIEDHGGILAVDSEPGAGARFHIYLPLAAASAIDETGTREREAPRRGSETILVAEDDPDVRELQRRILEEYGYRVLLAIDGDDALARWRDHKDAIDLLLLDVIMPKRHGRDVYEEAARARPDVRAILVSGYTTDIIDEEWIEARQLTFLRKPVRPDDLLRAIRRVLDG
jgi:PAS domain S-box-containing protein